MSADSTIVWESEFIGDTLRRTGINMPLLGTISLIRLTTSFGNELSEDRRFLTLDFSNGRWVYELTKLNGLFFKATLVEGDPLNALETQVE